HEGQGFLGPGQLGNQLVLEGRAPALPVEEALEEAELVDVPGDGDRVALVDAGEVLDLVGVELLQLLGDGEAVGAGLLEHAGGAVGLLLDDGRAAGAAELGGGGPLRAPEAADVVADRLPAMGAEVARL